MKNLLLNQCRWLILPLLLISLNVGNAYGDSWTWTPSSTSSISGTSSSVTLNSKAWTVTRSANNYIGWNADYGIQFGSKKAGAETVTFTSSAFTGTISSIDVNCGSYNRSHTLSVKVNNTAYSLSGTIGDGSTTATVTATGSSSGTIEIKLTAGSRACYIKSISITYSAGASKTLVYNANGGSGSMANTTGATVTAASCTFTAPTCKVFDHWNTAANDGGASYDPGDAVAASTTLYAIWRNNPSDPTVTFSNGSYTTGGSALNLSSLFSSNSEGAVTYSITNAGGTGASIAGTSFSATTAGSCTVQASQAADAPCYNAKAVTATITVSTPTPATITLVNYDGDATTTGYYSGGSFTLPSENDFVCGDLTFVGWSSVTIDNSTTKPSAATYHEPGESVTLGASNTFYAVFAEASGGGGASKTYSFTITGTDIPAPTGGGYQTGNTTSTATATDASGATMDVEWSYADLIRSTTSGYQGYIQFRNSPGYLYNTTDLGAISSIEISNGSNVASFRGTSENPTTDSGKSDGYFRVARSSGTGYAQNITITFTKTTGGGTSYSNYTTNCVNMRTVYLDASYFGESDKFAVYSWVYANSSNNKLSDAYMTAVTEDCRENIYTAEIPEEHDRVIFLHCSSGATPAWGTKDKQTGNLTPSTNDFFTVTGGSGDAYTGTWSTYTQQITVSFAAHASPLLDPDSRCVVKGGKTSTQAYTRLGYSLDGWFTAESGGTQWDFANDVFNADQTLHAHWTLGATQRVYLDTKSGSTDWRTLGNEVIIAHFYIDGTNQYQDIIMTGNTCDNVFYADAPYGTTHVSFARCKAGTSSLPSEWAGCSDIYNKAVGVAMASSYYYRVSSSNWDAAALVGSAYAPATFTISFAAGDYGSGDAPANDSKACGVTYVLPSGQVFSRNGYTMDGWSVNANGSTKDYNLGGNYTTDADQTFYPHWALASYGVTLNTNGGTINAGNVTSYVYGTGATLPTDVTKAHATFQGWYASSTFEGDRVYTIGTTEYGNKQYYAKWEDVKWTVTWKANGATVRTDANIVDGNKVASVPSAPSDLTTGSDGCDAKFVGWVIEANDPGALSISSQSSTPSGMFTNVAGSPAITANTTFIAIYRQEQ